MTGTKDSNSIDGSSKEILNKINKAASVIEIFDREYPEAACSLRYVDPLQLLVSTQLSAQCTDERVNRVTKDLFIKYRNASDYAGAEISELENDIRSTGFFRNKARNIKACCMMLITDFGGKVPDNMDDLLRLPGVGRKTANLVLGDAFGKPGIVVDTHAGRLARRIGFTDKEDPVKVEYDLMAVVPRDRWSSFSHQMVMHGREVCKSRKPLCDSCPVRKYCDFGSAATAATAANTAVTADNAFADTTEADLEINSRPKS